MLNQTAEAAIFETVGNLGDFIGGVGVVVTLVYLAFQIRQNTRASRATTFLGLTNAWQDYLLTSASPEFSDLRNRAAADPSSVSESDYIRLYSHARVLFRRFENDFFQYRSGTFDSGAWEGYRHSLATDILASASTRAFWEQQRSAFGPEFIAFIEEQIESARKIEQDDLAAAVRNWKELVEKESAV
jgi:hypothetical protein